MRQLATVQSVTSADLVDGQWAAIASRKWNNDWPSSNNTRKGAVAAYSQGGGSQVFAQCCREKRDP